MKWKLLAALLLGFILGAAVPTNPRSQFGELELQRIDITRLQDQVATLNAEKDIFHAWISAHDRQAVQDDLPGELKIVKLALDNIEKFVWIVVTALVVGTSGIIFGFINRRSIAVMHDKLNSRMSQMIESESRARYEEGLSKGRANERAEKRRERDEDDAKGRR